VTQETRSALFGWASQGVLPRERMADALRESGVTPTGRQWRMFLDRTLLWLGIAALAAAVVFFVAANWQALGRYAKFALVEGAIVLAVGVCFWRGLDSVPGRAALAAAVLLTGALLALVGQVYQTGADTLELFAVWAAAVFAWVAIGRQPVLWLVWLALVNAAVSLYFRTFGGIFGIVFGPPTVLWTLFLVNTAALLAWEALAARGVHWLDARWATRVLAVASGSPITMLALWTLFEHWRSEGWHLVPYALWIAAVYWGYRVRRVDLFVLAGGVLSLVIVVAVALTRALGGTGGAGAMLLIGLVMIACTAAGAHWLRQVAAEERA
jgi:uncharacterized membrane protein